MNQLLDGVAATQSGAFTTKQAMRCGVAEAELARLVRQRHLTRLGRGLYAVTSAVPGEAHLAYGHRSQATLLLYPDAALCGASALAAAGVPVWGAPTLKVELARNVPQEVLTQACRIRPFDHRVRPAGGCGAITAAVAQLGLDHGPLPAVIAGDFALHHELMTRQGLEDLVAQLGHWPYASRLVTVLSLLDPLSESVGESRLRVTCTVGGVALESQVEIRSGSRLVGRADFRVKGTNVLIEFDGKVKYASGDPGVLWAEKRREDELRRLGHVVIRVTWADLGDPGRVLSRIREVVAASSPDKPPPSWTSKVG